MNRCVHRTFLLSCVIALLLASICATAAIGAENSMVIGLNADAKTLGPPATNNDQCVTFRIYSALTQSDENFGPAPDLARSWEVSEDSLSYTFHLAADARFHDGTPVTSEDVEFSILEVNKALVSVAARGLVPAIESVDKPDAHTIIFHLTYAYPHALDPYYGFGPRCTTIVKKSDWEGTDYLMNPYNFDPIGSGPYKLAEWVRGSYIVLERWEEYWAEKPEIETIVYRIIPDASAMSLAVENGEVDWVPYTVAMSEVSRLDSVPGLTAAFHGTPCGDSISLRFNLRREPFDDIDVRRAIAYAINRDRIPDMVYYGGAVPAEGFVMETPFSSSWVNRDVRQVWYDPALANAILDAAGHPKGADGWRFSTTLHTTPYFPEDPYVAELVKADLAKVGISVKIVSLDYAAWLDETFVQWDFDISLSSLCSGPVPTAMGRLASANIRPVAWANDMDFRSTEFDVLLALHEKDPANYRKYVDRMQEILVERQPMVHLIHKLAASAWNSGKFSAKHPEFWYGLGYFLMRMTDVTLN